MLVPATTSTGTRSSSRTLRTPTWAKPWAEPPERTSPTRGRFGVSAGEDGATRRRTRANAPPAARRIGAHDSRPWDSRPVGHYIGRYSSIQPHRHRRSPDVETDSVPHRGPDSRPHVSRGRGPPSERRLFGRHDDPWSGASLHPGAGHDAGHVRRRPRRRLRRSGSREVRLVHVPPRDVRRLRFRRRREHARRLRARPHPLHGQLRRPDSRRRRLRPRPPRGSADGRHDLHAPRGRSGGRGRPGDPDRRERNRPLPRRARTRRRPLRHHLERARRRPALRPCLQQPERTLSSRPGRSPGASERTPTRPRPPVRRPPSSTPRPWLRRMSS